jgi:hypothetical protein
MEHYVGLDVPLKQTLICVVNQVGAVVRECVVDCTIVWFREVADGRSSGPDR